MLKFLPSLGIILFSSLYIFAASLYPGGSQADAHSIGFDWVHNYWCNLLSINAMNGAINPARPYAILAMLILCLSLAAFFYNFPQRYPISRNWDMAIQVCGLLSMVCASMIFTDWHDSMTSISSVFGLIALVGIFIGLIRHRLKGYIFSGLLCTVLLAVNNYIYYSGQGIGSLPLLQKVTFLVVLLWIIGLNLKKPPLPSLNAYTQ